MLLNLLRVRLRPLEVAHRPAMALPVRSHNLSLRDRSGTLIPMRATTFRSPSAKPILPYGLVQYIDIDVDIDVYVTLRQSLCDKGFLAI